jgi:hypothetical protein
VCISCERVVKSASIIQGKLHSEKVSTESLYRTFLRNVSKQIYIDKVKLDVFLNVAGCKYKKESTGELNTSTFSMDDSVDCGRKGWVEVLKR